jgi:ketosteroid isomerase-like protein
MSLRSVPGAIYHVINCGDYRTNGVLRQCGRGHVLTLDKTGRFSNGGAQRKERGFLRGFSRSCRWLGRLKIIASQARTALRLAEHSPTMKQLLLLLGFLVLVPLRAETDSVLDVVRQADDERVAATIAADRARLTAIFSDDLNYAHSSGAVDNKASYTETIVTGHTKYFSIDYEKRKFAQVEPNIVLMTGRCHVKSSNDGKPPAELYLGFLAVWRLEGGAWHFLAWQSCKLAPDTPPAAH